MTKAQNRIRKLNDELRPHRKGGRVVLTSGVRGLDPELLPEITRRPQSGI